MTSPRRSASMWARAAWLCMALACPGWGQISITAFRQDPAIPRAYVGVDIPKGMGVYMVSTCNTGASEASVFVDRVVHELPGVQDSAAVLYAARTHKSSTWKVAAYRIGGAVAMAAGGFASAGATTVLGQIAGGVGGAAGVSAMLSGRAADLARLDVPANWWTPDPTRTAALAPGQCMAPLLVALNAVGKELRYVIGTPPALLSWVDASVVNETRAVIAVQRTHPQIEDDFEDVLAHDALVISMIRERRAEQ